MRFRWWYPILYEHPKDTLIDYLAPITHIRTRHAVQWGWRKVRCVDRGAYRLMPLWLAWAYDLSVYWRWYIYEPLIRAGILVGPEGGYFSEYRWWCWNPERAAGWKWVKTGECT